MAAAKAQKGGCLTWDCECGKSWPNNGKVQPQEVVQALMTLPADTIFTHGAGDHGFYGFMVPVAAPGARSGQ